MISEITKMSTQILVASGLQKRNAQVFTRHLSEDVLGWVGLNRAVNREDEKLEINPVVGVRHQPLEALVAKLIGQKYHPYIPPTISTPLGYLMPNARYTAWFFENGTDNRAQVEQMLEAIRKWGYPFMAANSSLHKLIETMLHSGFGHPHALAYAIPAAYHLIGEKQLAKEYVNGQMNALTSRDDMAANHYRAFARSLSEEFLR